MPICPKCHGQGLKYSGTGMQTRVDVCSTCGGTGVVSAEVEQRLATDPRFRADCGKDDGSKPDMINHPPHYKSESGLECVDAMEAMMESYPDARVAACVAHAFTYLWRCFRKDTPLQNMEKARWWIDRAVQKLGGESCLKN